jgi:hypothetical protein
MKDNTYQVHTITCTRDKADIARRIQGSELIKRQALVHVVNWRVLHGPEAAIDPSNEFVDDRPEVLVLLDVLPRGNSQLHQYDLEKSGRSPSE